ncbi:MAG: hypothetical protein HPZ91_04855 [Lentisphaeria bacterium]|nr:hypothetical protein [Lentisphaeria bacterium]
MKFFVMALALFLAAGLSAGEMKRLQYQGLPYCQTLENPDAAGGVTLILLLHGRSRCGSDNKRQLDQKALPPIQDYARKKGRKILILLPQCPSGKDWLRGGRNVSASGRRNAFRGKRNASSGEQDAPGMIAAELVKVKMKEFNIPANRVFISGFSMGGAACYGIMMKNPGLFSRALIVSSGGQPNMATRLRGDFYLVQGENDELFPPAKAQSTADALRNNPECSVQLKVVPGKDHSGAADAAYTGEILDWLFQ